MQRKQSNRSLKLESLEARQMMAGDVDAFAYGKFLYVMGDSSDNGMAIVNGGDSSTIAVIGLEQSGSPTTINGGTDPVTFDDITDIVVVLGKGDDAVVVSNINLKGTLSVIGGLGADAIGLGNFNDANDLFDDAVDVELGALVIGKHAIVQGSPGETNVLAGELTVKKSLIINTGNGDDTIDLQGENSNTILKTLTINTGNGDDTVTLENLSAKNLNVVLGPGDDTVTVQDIAIAKNAIFNGVVGDDEFIGLGTNTYGKKLRRLNFTTIV